MVEMGTLSSAFKSNQQESAGLPSMMDEAVGASCNAAAEDGRRRSDECSIGREQAATDPTGRDRNDMHSFLDRGVFQCNNSILYTA